MPGISARQVRPAGARPEPERHVAGGGARSTDRGTWPRRPGAERHMTQARPVLPCQPRLRSLARLEAEIVRTEADRARWAAQAAHLEARRRDARAVRGLLQITDARLIRLARS